MSEMILVCGLSGSGKTDWAKEFVENTGYRYFCPDDFYAASNGDECIHENEFEVWIAMYQAIHLAEMNGQNCVVDTDALTKTHRTEFLDWFPSFEHHMVYIAAEKWLRYSNNDFRRRHVPEEEMKRMERRLEVPRQNEDPRWMSITVIENVENEKYVVRSSH